MKNDGSFKFILGNKCPLRQRKNESENVLREKRNKEINSKR